MAIGKNTEADAIPGTTILSLLACTQVREEGMTPGLDLTAQWASVEVVHSS